MDPLSLRASIPLTSSTLHHVSDLLTTIEDLPKKPSGVLVLLPLGRIYLQSGRVSWATFPGQQSRLRELLRYQRNPPIDEQHLMGLIRQCKVSQQPLAHGLLSTGEITEQGLRQALLSHSSESIARMATSDWRVEGFYAGAEDNTPPSFSFSTMELIAHLGASKHMALSAVAKRELREALSGQALGSHTAGIAFLRQIEVNHPVLIAVHGELNTTVAQARELCTWTTSMFDLAGAVDPSISAVSGSWRGDQAVVTWNHDDVHYTSLFAKRSGAALALSRLMQRRNEVDTVECVS